MLDATYYSGVAITILVLNALSMISLTFVIIIYIVRWRFIASFPMRLVSSLLCSRSIYAFPASYKISTSSFILPNKCTMTSFLARSLGIASFRPWSRLHSISALSSGPA